MPVRVRVAPPTVATLDSQLGLPVPSDLSAALDCGGLSVEDSARPIRVIANNSPADISADDIDASLFRHLSICSLVST
jgi:hypothetical protein